MAEAKILKLAASGDATMAVIEECVRLLDRLPEAMLLIPTETVYGLACAWDSTAGREKIFQAKKREQGKPLQMLASNVEMACRHGAVVTGAAERIARHFLPGPLTLVVPCRGGGTVGFRIPDHAFALELLRRLDAPLATTSANLSGEPPALSVGEALGKLALPPDLAVDAGTLPPDTRASTVVAADEAGLKLLREGPISYADIVFQAGN